MRRRGARGSWGSGTQIARLMRAPALRRRSMMQETVCVIMEEHASLVLPESLCPCVCAQLLASPTHSPSFMHRSVTRIAASVCYVFRISSLHI